MQLSKAVISGIAAVALGFAYQPAVFAADDVVVDRLEQRILELEDRLAEQEAVSADYQRLEGEIVTLRDEFADYEPTGDAGNGINISGRVTASWGFTDIDQANGESAAGNYGGAFNRTNDKDTESFNVDEAILRFDARATEPGQAGAVISFGFGSLFLGDSNEQGNAGDSIGAINYDTDDGEIPFSLLEAYINYHLPNQPVELILGRFFTWMGYETLLSADNPNHGHSYQYSIQPIIHHGAGAIWTIDDNWTFSKYIVNSPGIPDGTDDFDEDEGGMNSDDRYAFGGQLLWEGEVRGYEVASAFNYIFENNSGSDYAYQINMWKEITFNENWSMAFEWTFNENANDGEADTEKHWAVAKYITYTQSETLNYVLRTEYAERVASGGAVTDEIFSITGTVNWWVASNLLVRGELRFDDAGGRFDFDGGSPDDNSQFTAFVSATAFFGS